ncbi:hypothetical protein [Frigidibacter sp. MR17.24]|uniref:hypothetical protein n=1 Tax=Frigidibacter sp. MR17.24 TaxID=3127345 RepID=UPI003012F4E8
MSFYRSLRLGLSFAFAAHAALALTPDELKKQIDSRTSGLSGYLELLDDPDPSRSQAAIELMLASGDVELEKMAMRFALGSPEAAVRWIAIRHHFAAMRPSVIEMDASNLPDEQMRLLILLMQQLRGSVAPDKKVSLSLQPGPYNEKMGCYVQIDKDERCAFRINEEAISIYLESNSMPGRWVSLRADETGTLVGGANLEYSNNSAGILPMSIRILP